ncbi:SulP family inorganic anion transporter [Mumia sp. Pv 4-285]|uniref:SulP family inorganic anion transporter n=1 Tax=Mumia qirimensis TaxID=3234852 RepID=UPI00351CDA40
MTTSPRQHLLFSSFTGYQRRWLRGDLIAGLTVWAVLVPESLAYATIAGVPPVVGLYAAAPALVLYAALGSSRHLVVATMSGTAALSASVVGDVAKAGTADFVTTTTALAIVVGILGIVAGLCRLGFLSSFISEPVLKGFIIGLALTIIVGQVPAMLGIDKPAGSFFEKLWGIIVHLGDVQGPTLAVGAVALVAILVLKRFAPLVPASLAVVLLGVLAVVVLSLDDHGVDIVGTIPSGLPTVGVPDLSVADYLQLVGPAIGVLLIGFAEGLGAAKTYAAKEGYEIDSNRELLGLGASNIGSGLASGMVVNGSLSKTAVNGGAGARSQISTMTVAVLTIVTLLFLTGLFEKLPEAVLAAVVIAAVIELVDFAALRRLYGVWTGPLGQIYKRAARVDFIAAVGAMLGVLVFDTLPGLFIGISLSLITLLYRSSRPHVAELVRSPREGLWLDGERHDGTSGDPRIAVLRVESGLYFANADYVRDRIRHAAHDPVRAVVLDLETTPSIDVSAASMLVTLRADLERRGVLLLVAQSLGQVRDVLRTSQEESGLPEAHPSVDDAVVAAQAALDAGR